MSVIDRQKILAALHPISLIGLATPEHAPRWYLRIDNRYEPEAYGPFSSAEQALADGMNHAGAVDLTDLLSMGEVSVGMFGEDAACLALMADMRRVGMDARTARLIVDAHRMRLVDVMPEDEGAYWKKVYSVSAAGGLILEARA